MQILNHLTRLAANLLADGSGDIDNRYVTAPNFSINPLYNPGDEQLEVIDGREREIYETTAPLAVVIDRKAQMKSVGVYRHWKGNKNTKEDTELFDTPALNLLYNPNPLQSKDDFIKEMSINKDVMGVNYTFGAKGSRLNPVPNMIHNIQPELLQIKTKSNFWYAETMEDIFESFRVTGTNISFLPFEILRRALPNPKNPLIPSSPLKKIRQEISNIRFAMAYRNVILCRKGAMGMLSGDSKDADGGTAPMNLKEFEKMEKEYQRGYGLYAKQMQILMSRYPMKWQPMTYETSKLELFREVDDNMRKVIDLFHLNENLFSFSKGATVSDSGTKMFEAERQAYQNTIIPECEDDMNALSKWLGLHERGEYLTLDFSHVPAMHDDEELASNIMSTRVAAFVSMIGLENGVSREEALQIAGLKD